jgi:hypothetical protein
MKSILKYIGDTLAFTYVKKLIADKENKDLREFVAVMLSFTLVVSFLFSIYIAGTDNARLYLIITICSFIAALFGMEKFGAPKLTPPTEPKKENEEELG